MLTLPRLRTVLAALALLAGLVATLPARAVPAFASQTGQQCAACHVGGNWPALTPWGRYFKLTAYTAGQSAWQGGKFNHLPMGVWGQVGATWVNDDANASPPSANGAVRPKEVTVHLAGKVTDFAGVFLEYTNGYTAGSSPAWAWGSDVMDLRMAHFFQVAGQEVLFGVTANDGPGVQDVWNTSWAWSFPFYGSPIAPGAAASPFPFGLQNFVAGFGAYAWINRSVYAELSFYRTALGGFRFMSWGVPWNQPGGATRVDGYNPYWRLTYNTDLGPGNLMVGTVGMKTKAFPDNLRPQGRTDEYTDYGFDAQYQYLTDVHKVTVRASYLRENQKFNASFPQGGSSAPDGDLTVINLNGAYWRGNTWGLSLGYVTTSGSANNALYGFSSTPDTNNWVLEFDYMFTQNIKLMAQYNAYTRFNGVSSGASGNNSLYLNAFIAY